LKFVSHKKQKTSVLRVIDEQRRIIFDILQRESELRVPKAFRLVGSDAGLNEAFGGRVIDHCPLITREGRRRKLLIAPFIATMTINYTIEPRLSASPKC
jgi:hypothetical protein